MHTTTKHQAQRENDAWHGEAKAWLAEASTWRHEQTQALQAARAEVTRLESLLQLTSGHVDALAAHLATLERDPAGSVHERERETHQDQRARHAETKKAHHDMLRRGAR